MKVQGLPVLSRWTGSMLDLERISGPFKGGHYIAAYAVDSDAGYFGYAKICRQALQDVWLAPAVYKVGTDVGYPSSDDALAAAERLAQLQITRRTAFQQGLLHSARR